MNGFPIQLRRRVEDGKKKKKKQCTPVAEKTHMAITAKNRCFLLETIILYSIRLMEHRRPCCRRGEIGNITSVSRVIIRVSCVGICHVEVEMVLRLKTDNTLI